MPPLDAVAAMARAAEITISKGFLNALFAR
jgi:hypothetical protein